MVRRDSYDRIAMLSIEEIRALLPKDRTFTDEEVERIREVEYGLADAIFEKWLRERNAKAHDDTV